MCTIQYGDLSATLEQARSGDTGAFAQIVRQYQSLVSGVLFSATGDFHKSEDFTQETFLIAWQKLGELRDPDHLAAWLCTIARNLVHRSRRKQSLATEPLTEETLSSEPQPDAELIRREQNDFVWSAIGGMAEPYRETLVLYYRSGQSVREIADAMESTEEAVLQRLVRARKSLKAKLEEMVGSILTDSAPGEVFTMTVMAALGAAMFSTTAQAAVAATTGTAATGATTGGKVLGAATIWGVLGPVAVFGWIFALFFAGLWASVRNTPTLRGRRCQVHSTFWGIQYFCLFCSTSGMLFGVSVYWSSTLTGGTGSTTPFFVFIVSYFITLFLSTIVALSFRLIHHRKIKGVLENDLGLLGVQVESYSYPQVERQFFLSLITNILLAETILAICVGAGLFSGDYLHPVFLIGIVIIVAVPAVFTAVYYPLGRYFLEICRTKQNFLAAPPLVNNPFEVTLQTIGKPAELDYPKKIRGMFGIDLLAKIGLIGVGIFYFSWYSWEKHPIPLATCAFLFFALFAVNFALAKRFKKPKISIPVGMLFYVCFLGLILALEHIEFGGFYFSDAWKEAFSQEPRHPIRWMNATAILTPVFIVPLQFYYWYRTKRDENDEKEIRLREAIARYNPATMIADEPEIAAKPFPRHWIWIFGLYAAAIVAAGCVGVLVF